MSNKPRAVDLYCGLGGWTDGLLAEGYDVTGYDIEAHAYGEHRYPAELVLQDVCTLHGAQFKDVALIVASPPCFVADTLILTTRGLIPVPEVVVGDMVLTHLNRWRRVLRTGSSTASTVVASGYGAVLEGTAEHPIYVRQNSGGPVPWKTGEAWPVYKTKYLEAPGWMPLAECRGYHWASPVEFEVLPVPALPNGLPNSAAFWWMVGRWVGDGWLRRRPETGSGDEVIICCGHSEADELESQLAAIAPRIGPRAALGELHWRRSIERTTTRFTASGNALAEWLSTNFGEGASEKSWPAWALGMEERQRQALLDGYVSADGNPDVNGVVPIIKTTTVSKRLAISTRFLAASLGCASTTHRQVRPSTCEIEGRIVNQRDTWDTKWTPGIGRNRLVERSGGMQWGVVRGVVEGQESAQVWNLEVEDDNSYVADGVVVHNCQEYSYMAMPWSLAKAKAAAIRADTSGEKLAALNRLFNECFRIQKEASIAAGRHIPLVVENVKGAQPWVGRSRANFGSFYLWGDVPALMPMPFKAGKEAIKNNGGSWFAVAHNTTSGKGQNPDGRKTSGAPHLRDGEPHTKSPQRKMASAMIAKIPLSLSRHIAATYRS